MEFFRAKKVGKKEKRKQEKSVDNDFTYFLFNLKLYIIIYNKYTI